MQRELHQKNMRKIQKTNKIDNIFSSDLSARQKHLEHTQNVLSLELRLSAFIAEHNVAFQVVDHLVDVLKNELPDSKIMKDVRLKRSKCTALIKNVLPKVETDN
jgi:hypothetical protein